MLAFSAIFCVTLFTVGYSKPISECMEQMNCLDIDITQIDESNYRVCLVFDPTMDECQKDEDDAISHGCEGSEDEDKHSNWASGADHSMCQDVACDDNAYFGVKDGGSCDSTPEGSMSMSGVEGIYCFGLDEDEGGLCSGKAKSCTWQIPAPDCEDAQVLPIEPATTDDDDEPEIVDYDCPSRDVYGDDCTADGNCCLYEVVDVGSECRDLCGCVDCPGTDMISCIENKDGCCVWNSVGDSVEDGACQSTSISMVITRGDALSESEYDIDTNTSGKSVSFNHITGVLCSLLVFLMATF